MEVVEKNIMWELRNGKIISNKKMTESRLRTADMYDGKLSSPVSITVNHKLAIRIRNMTNSEYNSHFGIAGRKIG